MRFENLYEKHKMLKELVSNYIYFKSVNNELLNSIAKNKIINILETFNLFKQPNCELKINIESFLPDDYFSVGKVCQYKEDIVTVVDTYVSTEDTRDKLVVIIKNEQIDKLGLDVNLIYQNAENRDCILTVNKKDLMDIGLKIPENINIDNIEKYENDIFLEKVLKLYMESENNDDKYGAFLAKTQILDILENTNCIKEIFEDIPIGIGEHIVNNKMVGTVLDIQVDEKRREVFVIIDHDIMKYRNLYGKNFLQYTEDEKKLTRKLLLCEIRRAQGIDYIISLNLGKNSHEKPPYRDIAGVKEAANELRPERLYEK